MRVRRVLKEAPHFRSVAGVALLLAFALSSLGCGPVISTYLILRAQAEVDGAEAAEAEKFAPYEFTASKEYLAKAREEQGYSDFGPSVKYAWRAQKLALQGRERAESERRKRSDDPTGQGPIPVAPTPSAAEANPAHKVIIRRNENSSPALESQEIQIVPASPDG